MKKVITLLIILISIPAFSQLKEKDEKKLNQYEQYLSAGDIYKSAIKGDKLLEKYPTEPRVIDFVIRHTIELFKNSYNSPSGSIEAITSVPVRGIYYRKILDLLRVIDENKIVNKSFCDYYFFLLDYQYESPTDRPPTPFKELYESELSALQKICNAKSIMSIAENYEFSTDSTAVYNYNTGYSFFNESNFKQAIVFYKKAIKSDPNFIEAYDNLGLSFRQLNQLDSAIKYYNLSLDLHPFGGTAIQLLGSVYQIKEDYSRALTYYNQLKAIEPENPEGYYGCARSYLMIEQFQNALENALFAEKYYSLENSPFIYETQYLVGISYYFLGNMENAKKYLQYAKAGGVQIPQQLISELNLEK